ncbi:MAG: hypothetical protein ABI477_18060 [Chryseolinea sp.]
MKFNPGRQEVRYFFELVSLSILMLVAGSCGKPIPEIDGIDIKAWKNDQNGCQEIRLKVFDTFVTQKEKLLALSETDIVGLLGNPDVNELSDRNQKLFYYFLEPGADCPTHHSASQAQRLAIRFNAMGLAKEIRVERQYESKTPIK